jgi:hypothetical protein
MQQPTASTTTPGDSPRTHAGNDPALCRAVLESKSDELVALSIPGTSYRLHVKPTVPASAIATEVGKRISGVLRGKAQRIHPAAAGGRFIEPVHGHPRIVQGSVTAIDAMSNRLLVTMVVPVWLDLEAGQVATEFTVGQMVNMYVESGMTFTPA